MRLAKVENEINLKKCTMFLWNAKRVFSYFLTKFLILIVTVLILQFHFYFVCSKAILFDFNTKTCRSI